MAKGVNGRELEFKPHYTDDMLEYFKRERLPKVIPGTTEVIAPEFPNFAGFCASGECDKNKKTLENWSKRGRELSKEDPETLTEIELELVKFFLSYEKCKDIQENYLLQGGLNGQYKSPVVTFTMKNLSGYKDRTETEISGGLETKIVRMPAKKPVGGKVDLSKENSVE